MFTATLTNKQILDNGAIQVTVTFSDGVTSVTETIVPQDKRGYEHWVRSRIESLNTSKELQEEDNVNKEVVLPAEPEPTREEIDRAAWFKDLGLLERAQNLIDLGVIPNTQPQVEALRTRLRSNLKAEYLND